MANLDAIEAGRALYASATGGRNNDDMLTRLAEAIREQCGGRTGESESCSDAVAEALGGALDDRAARKARYIELSRERDSLREANAEAVREQESLRLRNATQSDTIQAIDAELKREREAATRATQQTREYREQRDAQGARAEKAERQLAEYRSLMAALPAGIALAYPAALPLLRAYLADRESD